MEEEKTVLSNGGEVTHRDVVLTNVDIHLSLWDRVKVLLFGQLRLFVKVYTKHEHCEVVGSDSEVFVRRLIVRKQQGQMSINLN